MLHRALRTERGLCFENFGKLVERVNGVVSGSDEEILPDHEVDLLLASRMRMSNGWELEDDVQIVGIKFGSCLGGRGDELLGYSFGDIEFRGDLAHLDRVGRFKIDPDDMAMLTPRVHVNSIAYEGGDMEYGGEIL